MPRLRSRNRYRLPAGPPGPVTLDRRWRDQVLGERYLRRIEKRSPRLDAKEENPDVGAVRFSHQGAANVHHRRRARLWRSQRQILAAILVWRERLFPLAREEYLQDVRARL